MKRTIRNKMLAAFGLVMLLFIFQIILARSLLVTVKNLTLTAKNSGYAGAALAKEIQLDVTQVQQWLTDISATRAAEGFDDGFSEAANYANLFDKHIEALKKLHPDNKEDLNALKQSFAAYYKKGKWMANEYIKGGPEMGNRSMDEFDAFAEDIGGRVTKLVEEMNGEAENNIKSAINKMDFVKSANLLVGLLILAITIGTSLILSGKISAAVNECVKFAQVIEQGDVSQQMAVSSNDELGFLMTSLNNMSANLRKTLKNVNDNAVTLFSTSVNFTEIANAMQTSSNSLNEKSSAVASASEEMSSNMATVSAAAEQSSTNINVVASATEEMTATINEIAQNSNQTQKVTTEAVGIVSSALAKVNELGDAAKDINQVIQVIMDIADQTKLLALNATIEAARAGEAGKGFAVVANEVKELAKQTNVATSDIRFKVEAIQNSTKGTVTEINRINEIINNINETVSSIASAVEEQSVTTKDIAANISQAAVGVNDMTANVGQAANASAAIAEDIAALDQESSNVKSASAKVADGVKELQKMSDVLKALVSAFTV